MLEAMAAGCPVVVTPEVGAADIVSESGGGIVVDGNPIALAGAIRALLADPIALERMGQNARLFVRGRYGWESVSRQTEQAYQEVIARK